MALQKNIAKETGPEGTQMTDVASVLPCLFLSARHHQSTSCPLLSQLLVTVSKPDKMESTTAPAMPMVDEIDPLTIAITRRDMDLLYLVLRFPQFMPTSLSLREQQCISRFSDYTHNPFLYAVKLQSITEIEVDDVNNTSRAAIVAYLFQHRQQVHDYLRRTGRLQIKNTRALEKPALQNPLNPAIWATTSVAEAEAMAFAKEVEAQDNPMPLSAIKLGLTA